MARGIDIHPLYQRHINSWPSIKDRADIDWVYVKASDGGAPYTRKEGGVVYRPDTQVRGAKSVHLPVGVYHYAQFGDPVRQADVLLGEHRRLGADLPPMLDLEAPFGPDATARTFAIRFCRRVKEFHRPMVYLSASMAGALRPDQWDVPGLLIWIASYGPNTGRAYDPNSDPAKVRRHYGGRYDIHQHTSRARIAGCGDAVDLNWSLANITEEDDMDLATKFVDAEVTQRPGTFGHTTLNIKQNAAATRARTDTIIGMLKKLQAGLSATEARIIGAVQAADGAVDVDELADALVEQLGDDVGRQLVAAIGDKLSAGATP